MEWYVYVMEWPDELGGGVFYVGKGKGDRAWVHLRESRRPPAVEGGRSKRKTAKCVYLLLNAMRSKGVSPTIRKVYETESEDAALAHERDLIAAATPGTLVNTQAQGRLGVATRKAHDTETARAIQELYDRLGSWQKVGDALGLNKGLVYSVYTGRVKDSAPVRNAIRRLQ